MHQHSEHLESMDHLAESRLKKRVGSEDCDYDTSTLDSVVRKPLAKRARSVLNSGE